MQHSVTRWAAGAVAGIICMNAAVAAPAAAAITPVVAWDWNPWAIALLTLAVIGYVLGLLRLGPKERSQIFGAGRYASFALGIMTIFVVLISPLASLDDQLFSMHMIQHLLLMLVAPPLLVWSRPVMAWLWAFPLRRRRAIGHAWIGTPGLRGSIRLFMHPAVVLAINSIALWFWHAPGPYRWALASEGLHTAEHLSFFIPSLAFWSLVLEPYGRRRLGYGVTMLFVAAMGMQMSLLGALLTFATRLFYATYGAGATIWGMTPLADQQLGGVLMWVPASVIDLAVMAVLFVAWLNVAEQRARANTLRKRARMSEEAAARPGTPTPAVLPVLRTIALYCVLFIPLVAAIVVAPPAAAAGPVWQVSGGNAARGRTLITHYGCASCHTVPGVDGADGNVGPPLTRIGDRTYIAGVLRNTPENMIRFLREPQHVLPSGDMPDMHVTAQDARDITAYLYTLR
jgi:cytochrome c oxidase assembly factor CtaG/cytochrome c2